LYSQNDILLFPESEPDQSTKPEALGNPEWCGQRGIGCGYFFDGGLHNNGRKVAEYDYVEQQQEVGKNVESVFAVPGKVCVEYVNPDV
jgi:hypothetical protein